MRAWLVVLFALLAAALVGLFLLLPDGESEHDPWPERWAEPLATSALPPPEPHEIHTWLESIDDATLESLTLEELWALGARVFDWVDAPPPGTTQARAIERFHQDRAWYHAGDLDPLGYFGPPADRTGSAPGSR